MFFVRGMRSGYALGLTMVNTVRGYDNLRIIDGWGIANYVQ